MLKMCNEKDGGKSMAASSTVQDTNRQLARQINEEARGNPQSPYANKWVGIVNGQVVVVADTLDEMSRRLRQIEPDPSTTFGLAVSEDPDEVHEIWGLR
jgi:hypoxanthine-guanine phosphoribosyltransferase